jgi:hypothetical protein
MEQKRRVTGFMASIKDAVTIAEFKYPPERNALIFTSSIRAAATRNTLRMCLTPPG